MFHFSVKLSRVSSNVQEKLEPRHTVDIGKFEMMVDFKYQMPFSEKDSSTAAASEAKLRENLKETIRKCVRIGLNVKKLYYYMNLIQ